MRLTGRSPRELAFRFQQAVANLAIWAFPPKLSASIQPAALNLIKPADVRARLVGSPFRAEVVALADEILKHRLPLLGEVIDVGPNVEWRRDYIHHKTSGTGYFRFIPYLDFEAVGDHKNIWELNRHQHLVVLAQAYLFTGNAAYVDDIGAALESWWAQNPFLKGINWASALEEAFRALSWIWIDHLVGASLKEPVRRRLLHSLYEHGAFLECNLSTYFSPNTHLLGEGVALHAIGLKLKQEKWRRKGAGVVDEELKRQVAPDGSHFEQSTYYHVYALDFFLLHYLLAGRPASYEPVLRKMGQFLNAITGPEGLLTCFGDDDGGRLFHPYGDRAQFGRATLATCSLLFADERFPRHTKDLAEQAEWWIESSEKGGVPGRPITCRFPDSGLASIAMARTHVLVDSGPFGFGGAGHSHADTLSVTVRVGSEELLIDPGTFTYIADPELRNAFRGTGFHNTIRIDGLDQAEPAGPFRWEKKPEVRLNHWESMDGMAYLDASCGYRGFVHRRRVLCVGDEWLFVLDGVEGPEGVHQVEQFWHLGRGTVPIFLSDSGAARHEEGLRSRVLGSREVAPVLRASWTTTLPHSCGAALDLSGRGNQHALRLTGNELEIPGVMRVSFGEAGMPKVTRV
jgi:hypothetical protein